MPSIRTRLKRGILRTRKISFFLFLFQPLAKVGVFSDAGGSEMAMPVCWMAVVSHQLFFRWFFLSGIVDMNPPRKTKTARQASSTFRPSFLTQASTYFSTALPKSVPASICHLGILFGSIFPFDFHHDSWFVVPSPNLVCDVRNYLPIIFSR